MVDSTLGARAARIWGRLVSTYIFELRSRSWSPSPQLNRGKVKLIGKNLIRALLRSPWLLNSTWHVNLGLSPTRARRHFRGLLQKHVVCMALEKKERARKIDVGSRTDIFRNSIAK